MSRHSERLISLPFWSAASSAMPHCVCRSTSPPGWDAPTESAPQPYVPAATIPAGENMLATATCMRGLV